MAHGRRIGVVTLARSDYGIYRPILRRLVEEPALEVGLYVGGTHLSPEFGLTVSEIEQDGFPIYDRIEFLLSSDSPEGIGKTAGLATIGFAQAFSRSRPDLLLVLGDRIEMLAAAMAALPFNIPLAHLHGGEATEGLIDEAVRHALTKFSHLHFVSTDAYRDRVLQMGEDPRCVIVSGAPSLDNLRESELLHVRDLEGLLRLEMEPAPLLVTFHPVTLEYEDTASHIGEVLAALHSAGRPVVFTYPNADTYGRLIISAIDDYAATHPNARVASSLGTRAYFSLMSYAAAMVGNSSSGIIEAASFALPVVNIGNRQRGRIHGANVIDVDCQRDSISLRIEQALDPVFRRSLLGIRNLYGDGRAAERIVDVLKHVRLGRDLLAKTFQETTCLG